ncbi:hypothetical protein K438DRAFT_1971922 [Mycena galopus ATCC 62051]|nr:hypothetical protein K438DRAFT_1989286 [Mycena galopus ATCC 62051]KAF8189284.1 hypothetical protein K438DRAFT_1971922 [Mycena galopus ATCC 62051]
MLTARDLDTHRISEPRSLTRCCLDMPRSPTSGRGLHFGAGQPSTPRSRRQSPAYSHHAKHSGSARFSPV